jgi:hypothetical protein
LPGIHACRRRCISHENVRLLERQAPSTCLRCACLSQPPPSSPNCKRPACQDWRGWAPRL